MILGLISACDDLPGLTQDTSDVPSGPSDYLIARAAAEDGKYTEAIAGYERVLAAYPRGKSGAEVRLEFAQVLLFANQPKRALTLTNEVPKITRNRELRGRAAIFGTIAQHIEVENYLAQRPPYLQGRDRARAIYLVMEEVYEKHGQYDEDLIIPARIRVLRESLAQLELRQMQKEQAAGSVNIAAQRARYILTDFADTETVRDNMQRLRVAAG